MRMGPSTAAPTSEPRSSRPSIGPRRPPRRARRPSYPWSSLRTSCRASASRLPSSAPPATAPAPRPSSPGTRECCRGNRSRAPQAFCAASQTARGLCGDSFGHLLFFLTTAKVLPLSSGVATWGCGGVSSLGLSGRGRIRELGPGAAPGTAQRSGAIITARCRRSPGAGVISWSRRPGSRFCVWIVLTLCLLLRPPTILCSPGTWRHREGPGLKGC